MHPKQAPNSQHSTLLSKNSSQFITDPQTFFVKIKTELFECSQSINPLVAAAVPLIHFVLKIRCQQKIQWDQKFFQQLCHEVEAFSQKALQVNYPQETITLARYLLCTTLDDIFIHQLEISYQEASISFVEYFYENSFDSMQLLNVLHNMAQQPQRYLDPLELGYICLSLGFDHKDSKTHHHLDMDELIEQLYQIIRRSRGENPMQKVITPNHEISEPQSFFSHHHRTIQRSDQPTWKKFSVITGVTLLSIIGLTVGVHYAIQRNTLYSLESLQGSISQ